MDSNSCIHYNALPGILGKHPEACDQTVALSAFLQGYPGNREVRILDSYGLEGYLNERGALYRNSPPKVYICFPPLRWQTYDVIIHSPRYDQNGNRVKDEEIRVFQNGKRIHYQYPVRKGPDQLEEGLKDFPFRIQLQDHNDVLWFRNIWATDLTNNPDLPEFVNNLSE